MAFVREFCKILGRFDGILFHVFFWVYLWNKLSSPRSLPLTQSSGMGPQALTVYQEARQQQLLHVPLQLHISAGKIRYRKVGAKQGSILDHPLLAV